MPTPAYLPAEKSLGCLHRAGLSRREAGFTGPTGRYTHQVDATNGDQRIVGRGATPAEAWYRAVEAVQACGMPAD
jgi:hypothetical protein